MNNYLKISQNIYSYSMSKKKIIFKKKKSTKQTWNKVIKEFNSGITIRQYSPVLHQIRSKSILKAIQNYHKSSSSTLKKISDNVIVSFDYKYYIIYKDSKGKKFINQSSTSILTTTKDTIKDMDNWKIDETYYMLEQSPIRDYGILEVSNVKSTPTSKKINQDINQVKKDFDFIDEEANLEDLLDLELNGEDDLDYGEITQDKHQQLPQELYNNHNTINDMTNINNINLDNNEQIPTTTDWDTQTGRCVYDYLIHYYSSDKSISSRLTYHKLFKFFNGFDLPCIRKTQISIWEEKNEMIYNEEVAKFWKSIIKIQDKYSNHTQQDIKNLGRNNAKEYQKIFIKVAPQVEEVSNIDIPQEYFKSDNLLGIMSKRDYNLLDVKPQETYQKYYKHLWSVSIRNIKKFCSKFNIPMYCLNQDDRAIAKFYPKKSGGHRALAFKVANSHFYGIEDSKTINSLSIINSNKTNLITNNHKKKETKPKKEEDEEEEEETPIKIIEVSDERTNTQYLYDTMKAKNIQVLNKNIIMKGNQILSFTIDKEKFIFTKKEEHNYAKELLGKDWNGEHIVQVSSTIFKELYPNQEHLSTLNNQVLEFLSLSGIKYRTHLGAINNESKDDLDAQMTLLGEENTDTINIVNKVWVEEKKEEVKPIKSSGHKFFDKWRLDKAKKLSGKPTIEPYWKEEIVGKDVFKCYDINKCYGAVLQNPINEFIVCDFNSVFIPFDSAKHSEIPNGLYTIDTKDFTLFHGSNVYSKGIVDRGLKEGIISHQSIKSVCISSKNNLPKNHFHKLINEFKSRSNGNIGCYKNMVNLMTGILGKSTSTHTKINISSSFDEFITYINANKDKKPFCYVEGEGETKIYMYGIVDERPLQENSLPIYIQILDESNIRLYDMIKESGGELLYRKTDCILVKNPTKLLTLDDNWGGYSKEKYPKLIHQNKNEERLVKGKKILQHIQESIDIRWEKFGIDDSSNFKDVKDLVDKQGGLMVLGRAGTGKSYVINNIAEEYEKEGKKVVKLAFTNIASLNIGGTTIHKFLKLNEKGELLMSRISKIKAEYGLIIIDEISMVSSFLWRRLYHLHNLTKIPFLIVGDFRQIPPVENMVYEDYREHPTLLELGKKSYIELEKIHRYDTALADLTKNLDDMMNIKKSDFTPKIGKVNICYLNKTRKKINALLNNKIKINKPHKVSEQSKYINDDTKTYSKNKALKKIYDEDNPTQDIYVYEGLPMISRLNKDDLLCNNERFIVKSIGNQIVLESIRASEKGEEEKHLFNCSLEDLQKYMLCAYCMTTHKSQGITIQGALTIHDWDLMSKKLRYTALTRAKKLSNIYMV